MSRPIPAQDVHGRVILLQVVVTLLWRLLVELKLREKKQEFTLLTINGKIYLEVLLLVHKLLKLLFGMLTMIMFKLSVILSHFLAGIHLI